MSGVDLPVSVRFRERLSNVNSAPKPPEATQGGKKKKSQLQIKLNLLYLFKTHSTSLQRILFDTKEIYCTVEIKIAWRDGGGQIYSAETRRTFPCGLEAV